MQRVVLYVAAFVVFVAFVILGQAPDGAAPAGKAASDAVAANLVNTVCASCHTLERVNNKKGDSDAWTTTVNRMKDKGAAVTDEQVPLLVEYLIKNAGTFTVAAAGGRGKGGGKGGGKLGKGGGFAPKNLKLLDAVALPRTMQDFVLALGLLDKGVCNYCHVEDRASDEKMQKVIARDMIAMVNEINARFQDGKQHVTCYTCHRGSPTPATAPYAK
jgi:Photosynthetic reaction centre cytochrome C subunit